MAEKTTPEKPKSGPPGSGPGAESPTTAQPIEFDDDEQELGVINNDGTDTPTAKRTGSTLQPHQQNHQKPSVEQEGGGGLGSEEAPPAKPPRPVSPQQQAEATLIEAFPDTDPKVIKAVLMASGGKVEPAFNALLGMSDPNFKEEQEEAPPARPPRPQASPQRTQMEQDEMLARQMMEHERMVAQRMEERRAKEEQRARNKGPLEDTDSENDFNIEEDFAQFRENIKQGFSTTQTKVNKWISDFRKRIDGEPEDDPSHPQQYDESGRPMATPQQRSSSLQFQPSFTRPNVDPASTSRVGSMRGTGAFGSRVGGSAGRRSTDRDYDADPRVISDNLEELELRDEESEKSPPPKPTRPSTNPDLFKPTPSTPGSTTPTGAPVPPQSGPVDEVDALDRSTPRDGNTASAKSKKWQPLTSVAPAPEGGEEDDPFSLGDDDEEEKERERERELKKSETVREGDAERLRKAAESGSAAGSAGGAGDGDTAAKEGTTALRESEKTGSVGTRDRDAEEILKGGGAAK